MDWADAADTPINRTRAVTQARKIVLMFVTI
jgi:hypothetical protein